MADADAVPDQIASEITGKVLAAVAKERATTSDETPRAKRRTHMPFGIKGFDVAKFLISMGSAVVVAYFGMKFAIEKNTAAIESNAAAVDDIAEHVDHVESAAKHHKEEDHKELDGRVQRVERTTDRIEVMQGQTLEAIRDLKEDIRESRRRTRRAE